MKYKILGVVAALVIFLGTQSFFVVNQIQQVIVLQFGKEKRVVQEPGLAFKIPFIEDLVFFDNRILDLDPPQFEVLLSDKKRINIDAYARYEIKDPLLFYKRVREEDRFKNIFGKSLNAALRRVIGKVALAELLSDKRTESMEKIREEILKQASEYGVNIVDVRIGRTNLPDTTAQAVYNRMRTEREREAREARAEGNEEAKKIRAEADKQKVVILSEAEKKAQILKGSGEAIKNKVLAKAYSKSPRFFEFYKTMQAYKKSFAGEKDTSLVLSPNSDFYKFLKKSSTK